VDLQKLVADIGGESEKFNEAVENIKNFLTHLDSNKIITPVRKITEFIEDDLMATDPKFFGTIVRSNLATEDELKKVTNTVIGSKGPMLKIILIVMMIGLGAFAIWFMYDSGILEDFGLEGMFGSFDAGPSDEDLLMAKYTPEQLVAAVDSGELVYDDLPKNIRNMYDSYEPPVPTATPKP